jgi:hypothetical protein
LAKRSLAAAKVLTMDEARRATINIVQAGMADIKGCLCAAMSDEGRERPSARLSLSSVTKKS